MSAIGSIVETEEAIANENPNRHYILKPGKHKKNLPKLPDTRCKVKVKYVENICNAIWDGNYFWVKTINIDPFWIVWWEETNEVDERAAPNTELYSQ